MLDLHVGAIPGEYRSLLPFLLTPASWQQKGSVPGLVKLLKAFLSHDAQSIVAAGQLTQVLGVVQQRLIPSKINDGWGFELLQSVVQYVPAYVFFESGVVCRYWSADFLGFVMCRADSKQYFRGLIVTLLTRMQTSKTDKYVYHFVYFLSFCLAIGVEGLNPDYVVSEVEAIQPRYVFRCSL